MSAWDEYVAAAQRLDATRRAAAAVAAEQTGMVRAAREELSAVRERLALQHARFTEAAARRSFRLPALVPTEAEMTVALLPGGPSAVLAAMRHARSTLDSADAELTSADTSTGSRRFIDRPAVVRNLFVYGAFAIVVLVLQTVLFVGAPEQSLPALAPICGLVLPLLAYGLGWLAVGIVYPPIAGRKVDRTPLVGAVVCLVAPVLLTCAGFGAVTLLH